MNSFFESRVGRFASAVAASLGLAVPAAASAQASESAVSPEAAPRAWIDFANMANSRVTEWLGSDDQAAARVRTHLQSQRTDAAQPAASIALKLWTDADGTVSRLDFTPFADDQANADLRGLLIGRAVGAVPPRDILLPLRLVLAIEQAPPADEAAAPADTPSDGSPNPGR